MTLINKFDAEEAIRVITIDMPNHDHSLVATMVDAQASGVDCEIISHREWREDGGMPHFLAVLHWTSDFSYPMTGGGDYIRMEITGTFKEGHNGSLKVKEYSVGKCYAHDPREEHVRPY